MTNDDDLRDQQLLLEIGRVTDEYGALHRSTVRDLARTRADLAHARTVLGTVAHDLRIPLSTVIGFTELLLDDADLTSDQRTLGERVSRAAHNMTTLVDELVEAVTLGTSPLRFTPVDVFGVLSHAITRHQLLRPARGVRVVLDREEPGDAALVIQGDEAKLERLVDNLVSNAIKFSPDHGVVHASVTADARHVEIRIRDDGPGIPAEQLDRIFAPFHRAPGAAAVPGVGLGLTIVKQITERHGGHVCVESELGAGAAFVVRLPLRSSRSRE